LRQTLLARDNRPYPAYHDVEGRWDFSDFSFILDHAQADPFAAPSKCRVRIGHAAAAFPKELLASRVRRTALADYLSRTLRCECDERSYGAKQEGHGWGGAKGGQIEVDSPGQQVLERTSVVVREENIEARLQVGLPARGRSIMGQLAAVVLCQYVPTLVSHALRYGSHDAKALHTHIHCVEDQEALRQQLKSRGLVAFVPDGAVLPRASGDSDKPLRSPPAVRFQSPDSLAVTLELPNRGKIRGMGIGQGRIVVCIGGGFHGKSTLLSALALGAYNHVAGDGREFISCVPGTASVRSEDGRPVGSVDISPFITNLPNGSDTRYALHTVGLGADTSSSFSTTNASGSTSCASGLMEALELGSDFVLIDEDSTATNFLVRDALMHRFVPQEPITPLVERARDLVTQTGATLFLVCGSSSSFLPIADTVVEMNKYEIRDVTDKVKPVALEAYASQMPAAPSKAPLFDKSALHTAARSVQLRSLPPPGKSSTRNQFTIQLADGQVLDLRAIPQVVHPSQTRALETLFRGWLNSSSNALGAHLGEASVAQGMMDVRRMVDELDRLFEQVGLDVIQADGRFDGFLARPRRVDIGFARTYWANHVDIRTDQHSEPSAADSVYAAKPFVDGGGLVPHIIKECYVFQHDP